LNKACKPHKRHGRVGNNETGSRSAVLRKPNAHQWTKSERSVLLIAALQKQYEQRNHQLNTLIYCICTRLRPTYSFQCTSRFLHHQHINWFLTEPMVYNYITLGR